MSSSDSVPANAAEVVIYTKPDCVDCFNAKRYLTNRKIPFRVRSLNDEEAVNALLNLTGPGNFATPILIIGRHVFSGFAVNRRHIEIVLDQKGL